VAFVVLVRVMGMAAQLAMPGRIRAAGADLAPFVELIQTIFWLNAFGAAQFIGFIGGAVLLRKRSESHKRLMLFGSIAIILPAAARFARWRVFGTYEDIPTLAARDHHVIDEVLIAPSGRRLHDLQGLEPVFLALEEQGIVMRLVVNFLPRSLSGLSFDELGGLPLLTFSTAPHDEVVLFVRRAVELVLASLLLALLSPVLLAIAIAIKLDSPGAVLFRQLRCGLHGRQFTFLKFRSMRVDAEAMKQQLAPYNEMDGPAFKMTNDPRVTPLGRFLRRTSLDELPQLWNIIRGDMSIVGPRPAVLEEVRQYEPWQRRRLSMKPGITGLWQVKGRNELTFEEWMRLDLEYIDNWSLWLDVKIALKTIPAVLLGRGAR
jgi:exopolysaccharide biosynthesis polyprenyl glycosylphosphotransferase